MRIDQLTLSDFRNLVDFEVDFDETSIRHVVVGRNGDGKSNLLEALTQIFSDLDLEEDSDFGYEIEYLCNSHFVKIESVQTNIEECKKSPAVVPQFRRQYWIAEETQSQNLFDRGTRSYVRISEGDFFRRNR